MSSHVMVALRVAGTPGRVFAAFTREIGLWWRASPLFEITPGDPGIVAFEPPTEAAPGRFVERRADGSLFVIGEITTWEPGRRLAFGWRQASFAPDQHTQVEVDFTSVGDETRVTVTHRGWDAIPRRHAAKHGMSAVHFGRHEGAWWRELLAALRGHVG